MKKINAFLYLNTHFSGIEGGDLENRKPALYRPQDIPGQRKMFEKIAGDSGDKINIIGVIVGGDNYVAEEEAAAIQRTLYLIDCYSKCANLNGPTVLFAGPCFKAGRYEIGRAHV